MRIQTLILPTHPDYTGCPFALVISEADDDVDQFRQSQLDGIAKDVGAVCVLVFRGSVELP